MNQHMAWILSRQLARRETLSQHAEMLALYRRLEAMYVPRSVWSGDIGDYLYACASSMSDAFSRYYGQERYARDYDAASRSRAREVLLSVRREFGVDAEDARAFVSAAELRTMRRRVKALARAQGVR